MNENRQRLEELLRRKRRLSRVLDLVAIWAANGATASPLSQDRQADLIMALRAARRWKLKELSQQSADPLAEAVREFIGHLDMVIIVGWDVNEEPAMLLSSQALNQSATRLKAIYPDGFLLFDLPATSALIIDFDDEGRVANFDRLSLSPVQ